MTYYDYIFRSPVLQIRNSHAVSRRLPEEQTQQEPSLRSKTPSEIEHLRNVPRGRELKVKKIVKFHFRVVKSCVKILRLASLV